MKKVLFMLAIVVVLTAWMTAQSLAGEGVEVEYEILLDELVTEGVLTPEKAKVIKDKMAAAKKKAEKETVEKQEEAAKEKKVFELPEELAWLKRLKFTGDLRLRYNMEKMEDAAHRHRGRYRFRFGVKANVTDDIFVAAGLATGSEDPRSTNQTMTDTFETPDIRFDYGYAQYEPLPWLTVKAGRIKGMPIWTPSNLLWDGAINPDGGAILLDYTFLENSVTLEGLFNTGFFILDEWRTETDPFMYVFQPGVNVTVKDFNFKTAVTYYGFEHIKRQVLDWSGESNTGWDTGLMYDYDSVALGAEFGYKNPFGQSFIPYTALFGEYIYNWDPNDFGYLVGVKVGHKKVSDKGSWQAQYMYRYLERDAWLDTFPDAGAYGGQTNVRGHKWRFQYGLFKHVILGADYYYMRPIKGDPRPYEHDFRFDTLLYF